MFLSLPKLNPIDWIFLSDMHYLYMYFQFNQFCSAWKRIQHDRLYKFVILFSQEAVSKSEGVVLDLHFTLAQLHLTEGHVFKACDVLRNLGSVSHKPGVVSTSIGLSVQ